MEKSKTALFTHYVHAIHSCTVCYFITEKELNETGKKRSWLGCDEFLKILV